MSAALALALNRIYLTTKSVVLLRSQIVNFSSAEHKIMKSQLAQTQALLLEIVESSVSTPAESIVCAANIVSRGIEGTQGGELANFGEGFLRVRGYV